MPLSHLLYVSRATRPMSHVQLEYLVAQWRRNNEPLGVTGLLLYSDGSFMQLLEGEQDVLERVFQQIREDDGHTAVKQMILQPVQERLFPHWRMGLLNLSNDREIDRNQLEWLLRHLGHPSSKHNRTADALALMKDFGKQTTTV